MLGRVDRESWIKFSARINDGNFGEILVGSPKVEIAPTRIQDGIWCIRWGRPKVERDQRSCTRM